MEPGKEMLEQSFDLIVCHNVFEYHVGEALALLHDEDTVSANFGLIREYSNEELLRRCSAHFQAEKIYGVRIFFGLQRNEWKTQEEYFFAQAVIFEFCGG